MDKDCTNDALVEFLKGKEIDIVTVETHAKDEVLSQVRTRTFGINVKPNQYDVTIG